MLKKFANCLSLLAFLLSGLASANCDDSTSTQRSTTNNQQPTTKSKFSIDEKNGTITIDGETRKIESTVKKIDKNKKFSRHEFELLKKKFGVNPQNSTASARVGCDGGYMNLGIYGEWTWGAYMENPYFWDYLYGTTVPPFTPIPFPTKLQCDTEYASCLAQVKSAHEDMQHFCNTAAVAAGLLSGGEAMLITYGACALGRDWANARATNTCNQEYARCLTRVL